MKTLFFVFILITIHAQANLCTRILELHAPRMDRTEALIIYLNHLLDTHVISARELARWQERLQAGELTNPIAIDSTNVDSSAHVHYGEVQRQIVDSPLDATRLLKWSGDFLSSRQSAVANRHGVQNETRPLYRKVKFLPVQGSEANFKTHLANWLRWKMKKSPYPFPPRHIHSFEMMSTPVTQAQWAEIMKSNPSILVGSPEEMEVVIGDQMISMAPNNPVTKVSWWSAIVFANRLSERAGLQPAYDISNINFTVGTSPEEGTYNPFVGGLRINAPKGNIYLAEGYRLPTEVELNHVLDKAGFTDKESRYGSNAHQHAWLDIVNPHPVATLLPYSVDGHSFYDLIGNVWEWSHERQYSVIEKYETDRIARNGPASHDEKREWWAAHNRDHSIGFRLVRTLKP